MFHARVLVDLPSVETDRRKTFFEWARSLFGAKIDTRSGMEELTVSAFSLFEGCFQALRSIGVTDAHSCLVDRKAVYVDQNDVADDLDLVWQALVDRRLVERPFREMHLVLAETHIGLHILYDLRVKSQVEKGWPELTIDLHARPLELRVQAGETAAAYAERVGHFARAIDRTALAHLLDERADLLAAALRRGLIGAEVSTELAQVRLHKPGDRQLDAMRRLPFGEDVAEPAWRGAPARAGAAPDTFTVYYHDPYWSLTNLILLNSMSHHAHWHSHDVVVVDSHGHELGRGDQVEQLGDLGTSQVDWTGDELGVSEDVPEGASGGSDDGWGGSDTADTSDGGGGEDGGWGGSDTEAGEGGDGGGDGGWGGSDTSDGGGDGGSSCSSSDGGSSCGSSCGGGGD